MKRFCSIFCLLFLMCTVLQTHAQSLLTANELRQAMLLAKTDTGKARYAVELSWRIKFTNADSSMLLAKDVIQTGYRHQHHELLSLGYRTLGILFVLKKKYDTALNFYDSAAYHARKANNLGYESQAYSLKAGMYGDLADYDHSIAQYTISKNLAIQSHNNALIASTCNNLADAYQHAGRSTSLVQTNLRMAIHYATLDSDSGKISLIAVNLAKEFFHNQQMDSMNHYIEMASRIFTWAKADSYLLGGISTEIAGIYEGLNKPSQVLPFASKAKDIFIQLQRPDNVLIPAAMIMKAHFSLHHYDTAQLAAQQLLELAKQRDAKLYLRDANKTLYEVAKIKQHYAEALHYLEESTRWNDSIFSIARDQSISNIEEKSQIAQKEFETKFKTKQKEQQNKLLQSLNKTLFRQKWLAIFTSCLLLISLGLLWMALRRRKKLNQELTEEKNLVELQSKEMETMMKEIHHRVKNNLTMLKSLLYLQSRNAKNEETKRILLESQSRIHSMALVHQRLYGDHEIGILNFNEFVEHLIAELAHTYGRQEQKIDILVTGTCKELSIETAIPLSLIINELSTNSFKYAFTDKDHGKITIQLSETRDKTILVYADNGKGLPEGTDIDHGGFGFKMIQVLAKQINASLQLSNQNGLTCTLTFSDNNFR